MPARKKTAKKTPAKAAKKKAPAKKASAKQDAAAEDSQSAKAEPETKGAGEFTSQSVNMGHVFSLRPRPNTSFRPGDFMTAKHQLKDEAYDSLSDAARAVVERALELTHDSGSRPGTRRDRP